MLEGRVSVEGGGDCWGLLLLLILALYSALFALDLPIQSLDLYGAESIGNVLYFKAEEKVLVCGLLHAELFTECLCTSLCGLRLILRQHVLLQ